LRQAKRTWLLSQASALVAAEVQVLDAHLATIAELLVRHAELGKKDSCGGSRNCTPSIASGAPSLMKSSLPM